MNTLSYPMKEANPGMPRLATASYSRRILPSLLVGLLCLLAAIAPPAHADTYVNRPKPTDSPRDVTLSTNTQWTVANGPYIIEAQVTIDSAATITLEPGVRVQLNANCGLYVYGTFLATNDTFAVSGTGN